MRKRGVKSQPYFFHPPPPRPNPTLSPAAAHRPESTPFVQLLPLDPIDHPPPRRRFVFTAAAATSRRIDTTVVDAMPSSPNGIARGRGRMRDGKRVRVPARVAQGPRAKKGSFSRDDCLARDGARLISATTSHSSMPSSPPPARAAAESTRIQVSILYSQREDGAECGHRSEDPSTGRRAPSSHRPPCPQRDCVNCPFFLHRRRRSRLPLVPHRG